MMDNALKNLLDKIVFLARSVAFKNSPDERKDGKLNQTIRKENNYQARGQTIRIDWIVRKNQEERETENLIYDEYGN